jgi:hypothetical protein
MSRLLNDGEVMSHVKTYVIDVNTSRTFEDGAHSPSWPNGLIFIIIEVKWVTRGGIFQCELSPPYLGYSSVSRRTIGIRRETSELLGTSTTFVNLARVSRCL